MDRWSDDRDEQLRAWRQEGYSYELIARMFTKAGFARSKGSVIGHAFRLGLMGMVKKKPRFQVDNHPVRSPLNFDERLTPVPRGGQRPIRSGAALFEKIKASRPAPAGPLPTPTGAGEFLGLDLMDLDIDQCRYPHGDGSGIRFCGQPQQAGSPYCAPHHRICNIKARAPL